VLRHIWRGGRCGRCRRSGSQDPEAALTNSSIWACRAPMVFLHVGVGDRVAKGEARVAVPEVFRERLDALARVQQHRGVEVPQGVHAVGSGRLDPGRGQRGLPRVAVDVAAVQRLALSAVQQQRNGRRLAVGPLPLRVTSSGGKAAMCLASSVATVSGTGMSRVLRPFGRANTRRLRTILTWRTTCRVQPRNSTSSTAGPKTPPCRSPQPAAMVAATRWRAGSASRRGNTCSAGQGVTLRVSRRGGLSAGRPAVRRREV
jgi:hypothetical protein